jgi:hypothetical protein
MTDEPSDTTGPHCKHGHLLQGENLVMTKEGHRTCRTCRRKANRESWERRNPGRGHLNASQLNAAKTHCQNGHPLAGQNLRIASSGDRRCVTCLRAAHSKAKAKPGHVEFVHSGNLPEHVVRLVLEGLNAGRTLQSIVGRQGNRNNPQDKIVHERALSAFRRRHRKVGEFIEKLAKKNRDALIHAPRNLVGSSPRILAATHLIDKINAAVPQYLSRDMRDDVIQNVWLAVQEGRLKERDISARVGEFIKSEYRQNHNSWGPRSLDMPISVENETPLIDMITRGLWD